jgi:hypothetical protein
MENVLVLSLLIRVTAKDKFPAWCTKVYDIDIVSLQHCIVHVQRMSEQMCVEYESILEDSHMDGIWSTAPIGQSSPFCSPRTSYSAPPTRRRQFHVEPSDEDNGPLDFSTAIQGRRTAQERGVLSKGRGFVLPRSAASARECRMSVMSHGVFVQPRRASPMARTMSAVPRDGERQPRSVSPVPRRASVPPRGESRPPRTIFPVPQRMSLTPRTTNLASMEGLYPISWNLNQRRKDHDRRRQRLHRTEGGYQGIHKEDDEIHHNGAHQWEEGIHRSDIGLVTMPMRIITYVAYAVSMEFLLERRGAYS